MSAAKSGSPRGGTPRQMAITIRDPERVPERAAERVGRRAECRNCAKLVQGRAERVPERVPERVSHHTLVVTDGISRKGQCPPWAGSPN